MRVIILLFTLSLSCFAYANEGEISLSDLSFNELRNIQVITATKIPENSFEIPSAVYVITSEEIKRSGATSIAEALRYVPGLEVAKINASKWAITARGFNRQFSNKLLVLIDGRSVYTPLTAGVFWDVQDTVLQDIDRIEVIRGSGATIWGANAVNGVINIITKNSEMTLGKYVSVIHGNQEKLLTSWRYGGEVDENTTYRVFGKYRNINDEQTTGGKDNNDAWYEHLSGFRVDSKNSAFDSLSLHGQIYKGKHGQEVRFPGSVEKTNEKEDTEGFYLLSNWEHTNSDDSNNQLKFYIDFAKRDNAAFKDRRLTLDIDYTHFTNISNSIDITYGAGVRYVGDNIRNFSHNNTAFIAYSPAKTDESLYNMFIQGGFEIIPNKWKITLGTKLEKGYFSDIELQPSLRTSFTPNKNQTFWAAISKSVRSPSRGEQNITLSDSFLPAGTLGAGTPSGLVQLIGNESYESEENIAYEVGYRWIPNGLFSSDVSVFYNDYSNLRTYENGGFFPSNGVSVVFDLGNNATAQTYGVESSMNFSLLKQWSINFNHTYFYSNVSLEGGSTDSSAKQNEGRSPKHHSNILSRYNVTDNIDFDVNLSFVSQLTALNIPSYNRGDMRLSWRPTDSASITLVGQNLFDKYHQEFTPAQFETAVEIVRSFYLQAAWKF